MIHEAAPIRIAHLTTAHPRRDVRIFEKECRSLAAAYEVHLLVADGRGREEADSVLIDDQGKARGRFHRMAIQPWRMWRRARRVGAKLYHFHDPELMPVALMLRWSGAEVIYDCHEDVPRAILSKHWIRPWLRRLVASAFETFENFAAKRFSAIVAATPHIAGRFRPLNPRAIDVNNFPMASELEAPRTGTSQSRTICYVGAISRIRGAVEMIQALEQVDARLIMAGSFNDPTVEQEVRALPGWNKVDYRGLVSRAEVREIMNQSQAGLLPFHPEPNHVDAQPNKMFEYMSAELPVIASNFPLWRTLLEDTRAGLCVDPLKPSEIAAAIERVLDHPEEAKEMGRRGRQAVEEKFQWVFEAPKLRRLYKELLA